MNINAAVIDDNCVFAEHLSGLLKSWSHSCSMNLSVDVFDSPPDTDTALRFDVLFLDVEMPGINGIDFAADLRKKEIQVPVIFVTSHAELAIHGYDVDALHFLVKDNSLEEKLPQCMDRVLSKLRDSTARLLITSGRSSASFLPFRDILYFDVSGHRLRAVTAESEFETYRSLKSLLPELPGSFIQISRFQIVNMEHVLRFNGNDITLDNGHHIWATDRYAPSFMRAYLRIYRTAF